MTGSGWFHRYVHSKILGMTLIAAILIAWELSVRSNTIDAIGVAPISEIVVAFWDLMQRGVLPTEIGLSLQRMAMGYSIAAIAGVAVGLLIGQSRVAYNLLEPLIETLRPIPSPAYIPIVIIFLGFGQSMKVFMIAFSAFWPIVLNTYGGVKSVDNVQIGTALTFGCKRREIVRKVILPASAPQIATGLRISLGVSLIVMIIAEMVAANNGIGYLILNFQRNYEVPEMYAGVISLAILGYSLNWLFLRIEHRVLAWHYGSTRRSA